MILAVAIILLVLFAGFTILNNIQAENIPKTTEELRAELQLQELNNPLEYLTTKATIRTNRVMVRRESIFHDAEYEDDGYIIEGTITNNADLANFKDVVVRVVFYSATKTEIGSKEYVLYEYYKPHTNKPISLHVYPPVGYAGFGFEVVGASGV